jgi:Tfp pilus assembly PilM family ATPase
MQSGDTIDNLYLLGLGAQQEQVAARLRETTGLAVSIPAPYTYMENNITKDRFSSFKSSDYIACISLALRGLT